MQNRRFNFNESRLVQKTAELRNHRGPFQKPRAHFRIGKQIQMSFSETLLHVLKPVPFLWQGLQPFGQNAPARNQKSLLFLFVPKKFAAKLKKIADVRGVAEKPERLATQFVFFKINLQSGITVRNVAKERPSVKPYRDNSADNCD